MNAQIEEFLAARPVAVVGASNDRAKYGNIVLRNLRGRGWTCYAVNPNAAEVEGEPCYPSLAQCPSVPGLAVVITPPHVSYRVLEDAKAAGVARVWLQPGAESERVLRKGEELGISIIHDACIMVLAAQHA